MNSTQKEKIEGVIDVAIPFLWGLSVFIWTLLWPIRFVLSVIVKFVIAALANAYGRLVVIAGGAIVAALGYYASHFFAK
jgi:hypothetical protein